MKESISIRNLGPLRDIKIDPIQPFTLFIGESASGKSTILKVVALFRYLYKMANIRSYLKSSTISKSPFRLRIESLLNNCGLTDMVGPQTEIIYKVEVNGNEYEVVYRNKKLSVPTLVKEDLSFSKVSFIAENRTFVPLWSARNRAVNLGFYFSETYGDFDEATNFVKEADLSYLPFVFDVKKTNAGKRYYITPKDGDSKVIELKNASSGLQTSAPLMLITTYLATKFSFKDALRRSVLSYLFESDLILGFKPEVELSDLLRYVHIHIEEPELSLYPTAQIGLIDRLIRTSFVDKSDDREVSLMIATHSPYIVSQLNVLLKAHDYRSSNEGLTALDPEKTAVYKVENGVLRSLRVKDPQSGRWVVDSYPLAEDMEQIAAVYNAIKS